MTPTAELVQSGAPERSLQQRMEALQRANDVRSKRAELKREIKAGKADLGELLVEPPEFLETAKVFDLMMAMPKVGRVKANKVLQRTRTSPSKTIGGLSLRQRQEILALLPRQQRRFDRS